MALSIATGAWYPGFFCPNKLVDVSSSSSWGKKENKWVYSNFAKLARFSSNPQSKQRGAVKLLTKLTKDNLWLTKQHSWKKLLCLIWKRKKKNKKTNTCLLLLIGSNGSNVSCKATVAAFIDLWVKNASGDQAHSLLSILQQGGLHPLDLQDLGLDICRGTRKRGEKLPV